MGYMRRPKTRQEKAHAAVANEEGVPPRGKRSPSMIPDSYDDLLNMSRLDRCWKRFRKTKWRRIVSL